MLIKFKLITRAKTNFFSVVDEVFKPSGHPVPPEHDTDYIIAKCMNIKKRKCSLIICAE